jgi:antitoxin component of RelBE/YafQ-DinJ toxin-antitoxin module
MRTISIRLDDHTDAMFRAFCEQHGLSQTSALKTAIVQLASQQKPTPAALAAQMGLIGGFRSGQSDLGLNHSQQVKQTLRAKLLRDALPVAKVTNKVRARTTTA